MALKPIRNDITKVRADAIVLPANKYLRQGSGASRGIFLAASEQKLEGELKLLYKNQAKLGGAVCTYAYNLDGVKYIIHAVCPQWLGGEYGEADFLYSAYKESLLLAKKKKCKSIAFPLLSTGNYQFPRPEAIRIAVNAIMEFLADNEMDVYLVFFGEDGVRDGEKFFGKIEAFIDDDYAKAKEAEEHDISREHRREGTSGSTDGKGTATARGTRVRNVSGSEMPDYYDLKGDFAALQDEPVNTPELSEIMDDDRETFHEMLIRLIDDSGMRDPDVYKAARISKQNFNKIKNKPEITPKKKTIYALAFALKLSTKKTEALLKKAGYAFSDSDDFDRVMKYCFDRRKSDLDDINDFLEFYGLDEMKF